MNFVLRVRESNRYSKKVTPSHSKIRAFKAGVEDGSITGLEIQTISTEDVLHVIPARFFKYICPVIRYWYSYDKRDAIGYELWDLRDALKAMDREKTKGFGENDLTFDTAVKVSGFGFPLDGVKGRVTGKTGHGMYIITLGDPTDLGSGVFQSFLIAKEYLERV